MRALADKALMNFYYKKKIETKQKNFKAFEFSTY